MKSASQVEREAAEIVARAEAPLLGPAEAWFVLAVTVNLALALAWWRWVITSHSCIGTRRL